MKRTRKNVLACLLTVAVHIAGVNTARSVEDEVTFSVIPASIEFRDKLEVPAVVVVRNKTKGELGDLRLSWFTDAYVTVGPSQEPVAKLAPGNEVAWRVSLSRVESEPVSGTVHLRVDYILRGANDAPDSAHLKLAPIAVSHLALKSASDIATVEAKTALDSLTEQSPGKVYLVVTNKSEVSIIVDPFTPSVPAFIEIHGVGGETLIEPHHQRALTFDVTARERVRPGKHLLLFEVPLKWKQGETDHSGTVTVTHEVEVGVLAESAILKLLGLPSFLLLPGFLWITTFALFWKLKLFRANGTAAFPLEHAKPDFWLVSISISILSVFVYRGIVGHDYLESYGLNDLVRIWGGAVVIGLISYLITVFAMRMIDHALEARSAGRTPTTEDKPLDVLHKLQRMGLGLELQTGKITIDQQELPVFLLQPFDPGQDKIWVGPTIEYDWKGESRELRAQAHVMLNPPLATPKELAQLFERGIREGFVDIRWQAAGPINRPRQVETAQLKRDPGRRIVVQAA